MGWMHDMLDYFELDHWFRQFHQNNITFSICYQYTENFMLALSHDEVVHGKSHLLHKMPGSDELKFANVRALLTFMWTHPGKKTIFMGMEFGQRGEWNVWGDLEWDKLQYPAHQGLLNLVDDLNSFYKSEPALWRSDFANYGFQWIDCDDNSHSVVSFMRRDEHGGDWVVVVCNFTLKAMATTALAFLLTASIKKLSTAIVHAMAALTKVIWAASSAMAKLCMATNNPSISACHH